MREGAPRGAPFRLGRHPASWLGTSGRSHQCGRRAKLTSLACLFRPRRGRGSSIARTRIAAGNGPCLGSSGSSDCRGPGPCDRAVCYGAWVRSWPMAALHAQDRVSATGQSRRRTPSPFVGRPAEPCSDPKTPTFRTRLSSRVKAFRARCEFIRIDRAPGNWALFV
jgi:hypothetical protein